MNLFLFTNFFPFKKAEPFLVNEFKFTKEYFDEINVLALYGKTKDAIVLEDKKTKIYKPILESHTLKKKLFLGAIFNTASCYFHIKDFFGERIFLSPKKMYWFLISLFITRTVIASKQYMALVNQIKSSSSEPVLYFYWADNLCWIIPYLKRDLKQTKCTIIIRLHRTDLYEDLKNNYAPLRKDIFSCVNLIVPISEDGENYLLRKYPLIKPKLFLSRLGVFDNGLNAQNTADTKQIVSVSGLVEVKRVHLIFEALQHTQSKICWHHFGDGVLENQLRELIKQNRENLEIILHGFVDNAKLMAFYKTHSVDLLLNVSASEGLPVSIMEALSFGIPVIATNVGGTAELVNDQTGCLIPSHFDAKELSVMIDHKLSLGKPETQILRANARKMFEEKVSAEKNYKIFYNKISSIVG